MSVKTLLWLKIIFFNNSELLKERGQLRIMELVQYILKNPELRKKPFEKCRLFGKGLIFTISSPPWNKQLSGTFSPTNTVTRALPKTTKGVIIKRGSFMKPFFFSTPLYLKRLMVQGYYQDTPGYANNGRRFAFYTRSHTLSMESGGGGGRRLKNQ